MTQAVAPHLRVLIFGKTGVPFPCQRNPLKKKERKYSISTEPGTTVMGELRDLIKSDTVRHKSTDFWRLPEHI